MRRGFLPSADRDYRKLTESELEPEYKEAPNSWLKPAWEKLLGKLFARGSRA